MQLWYYETILPNLKLKTRPKQLLGSLPLDIALPAETQQLFGTKDNLVNGSWVHQMFESVELKNNVIRGVI